MRTRRTLIPFYDPQISVLFVKAHKAIYIRVLFIRISFSWRWYLMFQLNKRFGEAVLGPVGLSLSWGPSEYEYQLVATLKTK